MPYHTPYNTPVSQVYCNGIPIEYVKWSDTDEGVAECEMRDDKGRPIVMYDDYGGYELMSYLIYGTITLVRKG